MSTALLSSEEVTKFVVLQGHGVKGLVETGLQTLPDKYVQPLEQRLDMSRVINGREDSPFSLPIIDVSNWENPLVGGSVCDAAERWGFFQIVGHGVPLEMLEKVKETAHKFFEMPTEEKRKYLKENQEKIKYPKENRPQAESAVHLGTSFNPGIEKVHEWNDFLTLLHIPGDDSVSESWPSFCRELLLDYKARCEDILKNILTILLQHLNVTDIVDKPKSRLLMGSIRVNLNYYPICPNPDLAIGIGRHSDISTLAILLQDDTGGLYVRVSEDENTWVHVEPTSGALVINVGDALEICSNGRYRSVEHCVVPNRYKNRVSIPIFANPASDAVVGPLPEVLESDPKPLYKQVVFFDYLKHFLEKGRHGKTTIDYVKI